MAMPNKPPVFGRKRPVEKRGGSLALRDTSSAYKRLRGRILDAEPLCRFCRARGHITAATVLDHIVALSLGGTNDPANYAPACQPCNQAKANVERRVAARGGDDARLDPELMVWIRLASRLPDAPPEQC